MRTNTKTAVISSGYKQNHKTEHLTGVLSVINSNNFRQNTQQKRCDKCKTDDLKFAEIVQNFWLCIRCLQRAEHLFKQKRGRDYANK